MKPKYGSTSLCDQNCGVQSGYGQTDRKVKTEEPKILSNVIIYFKYVIIGCSIIGLNAGKSFSG